MLEIILVTVSQFMLIFFKHLAIRTVVEVQVVRSAVLTFAIQVSWLISAAIGINAVLDFDWVVIGFYLAAGVLGNYLSLKINIKEKRIKGNCYEV